MRWDAEENRVRILAAARAVFSEVGEDAPMIRVARRARLSVATLRRRFPTRDDLTVADFRLLIAGNRGVVAAAGTDPAVASRRYVTHMLRSFA
ncbi:TetR family transcriptional regulator [Actinoplanes rectilineatus]|uniref:TetR family transcriptional regulator n=1 Tax=Actinoplanes rectilineatus TaxID=113571 RepID=UPI0006979A28|nr:TetR family transcriptional regulator [Actinoplanes rectilineatus]